MKYARQKGTRHRSGSRRRTRLGLVLGVLALLATLVGGLVQEANAGTSTGQLKILALGDSYTAGNGSGPYSDYYGATACYRSLKDYANQFAARVGAVSDVYACSGAVTNDFWAVGWGRPAMIDWVDPSYDVIFLTIGGNDLNFGSIVQHCDLAKTRRWDSCASDLNIGEKMLNNGTMYQRIYGVLSGIYARASRQAKIVLTGYPLLEANANFKLYSGKGNTGSVVNVGQRIRQDGYQLDSIEQKVVGDLNSQYLPLGFNPFIYNSVIGLFEGPPNHELSAGYVNSNRWMMQPSVDTGNVNFFYHPNATGWSMETTALVANAAIPHTPYVAAQPTCPPGQTGTPPNCTTPPPSTITCPDGSVHSLPYTCPPPTQSVWPEQETPNHPVNTFVNPHNASGMGPAIAAGQWVNVACRLYDPTIISSNPDGWWYKIADSPWNGIYYATANTFMNGDPVGGPYTHNTDFNVAVC